MADGMSFALPLRRGPKALRHRLQRQQRSARHPGSHYDLLASEARIASLVAIAKGDAPQEHWFRMARPRTAVSSSKRVLLSWSGSMFEYLMPLLVTKSFEGTLLAETYVSVIERQMAYGTDHAVPWGVSESAFNVMDLAMTYQYRAFGVPGLGLKAGLGEDLVVAPYATALPAARLVEPKCAAAVAQLSRARQERRPRHVWVLRRARLHDGAFAARAHQRRRQDVHGAPSGHDARRARQRAWQHGALMQDRFHRDPRVRSCELLLEERHSRPQGASRRGARLLAHRGRAPR